MEGILKLIDSGLPSWLIVLAVLTLAGKVLPTMLKAFELVEKAYPKATVKAWRSFWAFCCRQKALFNDLSLPENPWQRGPVLVAECYSIFFYGLMAFWLSLEALRFSTWLFLHAMPTRALSYPDFLKALGGVLLLGLFVGGFSALTRWQYRRVSKAVAR